MVFWTFLLLISLMAIISTNKINFSDFARKFAFRTYKALLIKAGLPTNASSKLYSDKKTTRITNIA